MNLRAPINYGFVIALSHSALMVTLVGLAMLGPEAISSDREMIGGTVLFLMIYLTLLFGIYFVLKKEKERNGGVLSFKVALQQGVLTGLSTAVFSVLFTILFYEFIYPEYVSDLLAAIQEKMELENIPSDKIEQKLAERTEYFSTLTQSLYSFTGNFITGIAFTLLLGFFLKHKS